MVGALVGLAFAAVFIARRIVQPLNSLRKDTVMLADGALTEISTAAPTKALREIRADFNRIARAGREREQAAERGQADLRALMNRMEEGVLALSSDGTLRVANRAAREVLGMPQDSKSVHTSAVPRRELRAFLNTALQTSIRPRELNVADRVILAEANLSEDGVAIVSLRDVTDVRRLEEVRTDFVANASHELKTPLTAVRGFAETLLEDDPTPEIRQQFLTLIHDNTLRLQAIVEDLLDLSRLESGGWTPDLEPVEVGEVATRAWAEVVEARGATRNFTVIGEALLNVDRRGLSHILRNLVDNALRHTEEDGNIRVRVSAEGQGRTRITVEDDGSGIPPDALPRVFERFFRVDRARSRAHGGTGLGLAIVSHLTARMGGSVEAESQFGIGTKIHVILPTA